MHIYANGRRPKTLEPGDKLSVKINPLRDGKPGGVVLTATTPDAGRWARKGMRRAAPLLAIAALAVSFPALHPARNRRPPAPMRWPRPARPAPARG